MSHYCVSIIEQYFLLLQILSLKKKLYKSATLDRIYSREEKFPTQKSISSERLIQQSAFAPFLLCLN